jgi:hypothetical protein
MHTPVALVHSDSWFVLLFGHARVSASKISISGVGQGPCNSKTSSQSGLATKPGISLPTLYLNPLDVLKASAQVTNTLAIALEAFPSPLRIYGVTQIGSAVRSMHR